jgi:spermidine/putrescine transport system permease protein
VKEQPGGTGLPKRNYGLMYSGPIALWFTVFFVAPLGIIVVISFMRAGADGSILIQPNLDSYVSMLRPELGMVAFRTLWVALVSTVITLLLALPCGYAMARSKRKTLLLILVIIPFWTNFIIRVFAWKRLLDANGLVNQVLLSLNAISSPLPLMRNYFSVILINIYTYLPYAILPLYSTMEKFDFTLLEAARDLGATKPQAIMRVLLPNIRGGVITSVFFTFIPLLGSFVVQQLAGDKNMYMLGNIITDRIKNRNLPLSSAISVLIMVFTTLGIYVMLRFNRKTASAAVGETLADQGIKLKPFRFKIEIGAGKAGKP